MHPSRRTVLAKAALAPLILPSWRGRGQAAPSERITTALVGHGVMGRGHLRVLASRAESQLLAMCDVDRTRRDEAISHVQGQGVTACNDYRELLARDDIDAMVVVTPDHWHSQISIEAARAGKDIYCEKPVSLTIREGRQLADTVTRYARVFQTGTQYRSIPTIRRVCQFVREGGLGQVKSVYTKWGKGSRFPGANPYIPVPNQLPGEPVPEYLDWDRWLGPAPWRPYNRAFHPNPPKRVVPWVFCSDFGAGAVTGYHSHAADVIQYAIGMETGGPVIFHHPKDGNYPTLTCEYADGVLLHLVENWDMVKSVYHAVPDDARLAGNFGGVFVGERGWVTSMTTGGPVEGGPHGLFQRLRLKSREPNIGGNTHYSNWFECVRDRQRPSSHEEIGHRSASLGHLTIIAYQLERSLKWDPAREIFPEDPEANRLLSRARREPFLI